MKACPRCGEFYPHEPGMLCKDHSQVRAYTDEILTEILSSGATRKSVAILYAQALDSTGTDWTTVNKAIVGRWSFSGLSYVKKLAWKGDASGAA